MVVGLVPDTPCMFFYVITHTWAFLLVREHSHHPDFPVVDPGFPYGGINLVGGGTDSRSGVTF